MMNYNYQEGVEYMRNLACCETGQYACSFLIEGTDLIVQYPGRKKQGDYRLVDGAGNPPTHVNVAEYIVQYINDIGNLLGCIQDLENIYNHGLQANTNFISDDLKKLIFWVTLQEEINYPQPRYLGRKLPFQRYYEAILSTVDNGRIMNFETVRQRINNNGRQVPGLIPREDIVDIRIPVFYE